MKQVQYLFLILSAICITSCDSKGSELSEDKLYSIKVEITNTGDYADFIEGVSFQIYSEQDVSLKGQEFESFYNQRPNWSFSHSTNVQASNTYETSVKVKYLAFSVGYGYEDVLSGKNPSFVSNVKIYIDNKLYKEESFTITKDNASQITYSVPDFE